MLLWAVFGLLLLLPARWTGRRLRAPFAAAFGWMAGAVMVHAVMAAAVRVGSGGAMVAQDAGRAGRLRRGAAAARVARAAAEGPALGGGRDRRRGAAAAAAARRAAAEPPPPAAGGTQQPALHGLGHGAPTTSALGLRPCDPTAARALASRATTGTRRSDGLRSPHVDATRLPPRCTARRCGAGR
jgi:hypothetical protein